MAPKAPSAAPLPKIPAKSGANPALVGVISLAVGLVAGYGVGRATLGAPANPLAPSKGSYQDGYEAAHKKLLASGLVPQAQGEVNSIGGSVVSIGDGKLVLSTDYHSPDPLSTVEIPAQRTVTVTGDTKITETSQKDPIEFQKEFQEFQKTAQKDPSAVPPSPVFEKTIALTDLKEGDTVTVTAGNDILAAASFTATSISLTTQQAGTAPGVPVAPPAPPPPPPQQ